MTRISPGQIWLWHTVPSTEYRVRPTIEIGKTTPNALECKVQDDLYVDMVLPSTYHWIYYVLCRQGYVEGGGTNCHACPTAVLLQSHLHFCDLFFLDLIETHSSQSLIQIWDIDVYVEDLEHQ